mgnify:CR=1 FL=1
MAQFHGALHNLCIVYDRPFETNCTLFRGFIKSRFWNVIGTHKKMNSRDVPNMLDLRFKPFINLKGICKCHKVKWNPIRTMRHKGTILLQRCCSRKKIVYKKHSGAQPFYKERDNWLWYIIDHGWAIWSMKLTMRIKIALSTIVTFVGWHIFKR